MAIGRKTGGRKKGTPNKLKIPQVAVDKLVRAAKREAKKEARQELAEALAAPTVEERVAAAVAALEKTPLEILLEFMMDESYPPGFRKDCAKDAAQYIHAKAGERKPDGVDEVKVIAEIRRVIVDSKHDGLGANGGDHFSLTPDSWRT